MKWDLAAYKTVYSAIAEKLGARISDWNKWSGRKDLNLRPPGPEPGALARLRYAPTLAQEDYSLKLHHKVSTAVASSARKGAHSG